MATNISLHDMKTIRASTVQGPDCAAHVTFEFEGEEFTARAQVTVFIDDELFCARLIDLINDMDDGRKPVHVYPVVGSDDEPAF